MALSDSRAMPRPSHLISVGGICAPLCGGLLGEPCVSHLGHVRGLLFWCEAGPVTRGSFAELVGARASGLLLRRRPATVLWRVGSVVVDSVYRVARRWSSAHVGQKRRVRGAPSLAHSYPAPPIVEESNVARVVAARLHGSPNLVLWRERGSAAFAVPPRSDSGARSLASDASASVALVRSQQIASQGYALAAAVALTQPADSGLIHRAANHYQTIKSTSSQVAHVFNSTTKEAVIVPLA